MSTGGNTATYSRGCDNAKSTCSRDHELCETSAATGKKVRVSEFLATPDIRHFLLAAPTVGRFTGPKWAC